MKKFLMAVLICFICSLSAMAVDYVQEKQSIYFNPQTSEWSYTKNNDSDIQLTNHSYIGSGGFQEYLSENGEVLIGANFNVSYIQDGKFIAIDFQNLKFYSYSYEDGKFVGKELSEDCVKALYPNYEIVKISDFKNNKIVLYKKFFTKKDFLLLNDTTNSFYKYTYRPSYVNRDLLKPFVRVPHRAKIEFSHYGDDTKESPTLRMYVRNKF